MAKQHNDAPAALRERQAEPIFAPGGRSGVLLLHGYSGLPGELSPLAAALARAGHTVYAPLLPGHGGAPDRLHGVRWEDWAAAASDGLARLRRTCDRLAVAGLSMGGLLALHLAAREPLQRVVAMAPALHPTGERQLRLTGLLKLVMPWFYPLARADFRDPRVRAMVLERAPAADLDDPAVVARVRREARIPVGSLYELVRLQARVARDLPRVRAPLLLLHGRRDTVVQARSVEVIAARAGSPMVQIRWFAQSGHLLPLDVEAEAVCQAVLEWVNKN